MTETETRLGLQILGFETAADFERWLSSAPRPHAGVWVRLAKKGVAGLAKTEAIDAALCHGWIDGQQHPYDERFWLTRFTTRRPGSRWSDVNRTRSEELITLGRIAPAGFKEINEARADGRWEAAYAPARRARPDTALQAALDVSPGAADAYAALASGERYAILYRLANLKTPAGYSRALLQIVRSLEQWSSRPSA